MLVGYQMLFPLVDPRIRVTAIGKAYGNCVEIRDRPGSDLWGCCRRKFETKCVYVADGNRGTETLFMYCSSSLFFFWNRIQRRYLLRRGRFSVSRACCRPHGNMRRAVTHLPPRVFRQGRCRSPGHLSPKSRVEFRPRAPPPRVAARGAIARACRVGILWDTMAAATMLLAASTALSTASLAFTTTDNGTMHGPRAGSVSSTVISA